MIRLTHWTVETVLKSNQLIAGAKVTCGFLLDCQLYAIL
jgi:hypothetical protein